MVARVRDGGAGLSAVPAEVWLPAFSAALISVFSGRFAQQAEQNSRISRILSKSGLYLIALLGPLVMWLIFLEITRRIFRANYVPFCGADAPFVCMPQWLRAMAAAMNQYSPFERPLNLDDAQIAVMLAISGLAMAGIVGTALMFNINWTSFHRFYRDRLSRALIFRGEYDVDRIVRTAENDEQLLSELNTTQSPYHLINATLNLQNSRQENLRGRNGGLFVFSRNYCGSQLLGYRATDEMERMDPSLDLATAMAVSGAAAAPNMGRSTVRFLTFILALLNIRLGYWLPNPRRELTPRRGFVYWASRPWRRVGPFYLFREMLGWVNERSANVNLSDGGHMENLGLFNLLRRRCRVIVVSDAEADQKMTFGGLAHVIRLARIDLAVTVDINLDKLRLLEKEKLSQQYCAIGKIDYGEGIFGWLIYIKAAMTGQENPYVRTIATRTRPSPTS
jgi:hypothetical protein